jgi:hypothetical protein
MRKILPIKAKQTLSKFKNKTSHPSSHNRYRKNLVPPLPNPNPAFSKQNAFQAHPINHLLNDSRSAMWIFVILAAGRAEEIGRDFSFFFSSMTTSAREKHVI